MELELTLRKNKRTGSLLFYIPKIFSEKEYALAFVSPKLVEGRRYKIIIEEVQQ